MTAAVSVAAEAGFVHATALVLGEAGIVIFGPSGAGKSALALALIEGAAPGCFARLIGDDRVRLTAHGARLLVEGHPRIVGRIERRGHAILTLPYEAAAVVRLIVELGDFDGATSRLPDGLPPYRQDEIEVPRLGLAGRLSALAQEAAVKAALADATEM